MAALRVAPYVCAYSDENEENLHIEIELPGVDKKDITFKMQETSFFHRCSPRRHVGTWRSMSRRSRQGEGDLQEQAARRRRSYIQPAAEEVKQIIAE